MDTRTAERLINAEMFHYGLIHLGWRFKWDRAKRRRGSADSTKKVITLSKPLTEVRTEADVRMTILHECAHAIVGTHHMHDSIWRRQFIQMGGDGKRCSTDREASVAVAKYVVTCNEGGEVLGHINRMLKQPENRLCKTHRANITISLNR